MPNSFEDIAKIFAEKRLESNVLIRNVHLDLNSIEESTGIENDKYKLLVNRFKDLGLYFFYALTKHGSACPERAKINLLKEEYEERIGNHLPLECSYINLEKPIIEDKDMLIHKIRHSHNNFEYVAKITQLKLNEIKNSSNNIKQNIYISEKTKEKILVSLGVQEISNDFIENYDI